MISGARFAHPCASCKITRPKSAPSIKSHLYSMPHERLSIYVLLYMYSWARCSKLLAALKCAASLSRLRAAWGSVPVSNAFLAVSRRWSALPARLQDSARGPGAFAFRETDTCTARASIHLDGLRGTGPAQLGIDKHCSSDEEHEPGCP